MEEWFELNGTIFKGKDMVNKFINWVENLQIGVNIIDDVYKIPATRLEE